MIKVRGLAVAQVVLPVFVLLGVSAMPVPAQDAYSMGNQSYARHDYKAAASFYLKALAASPNNAILHYQLANSYFQMHERAEARAEYSRCLSLNPDKQTNDYCLKMLAAFGSPQGSPAASAVTTAGSSAPAASGSSLEARRQAVLTQANKEADAIRAEAEKQLKDLAQTSNLKVVNPLTGDVGVGVSQAQRDEIMGEAEARAKKIVDRAQDKAKHMQ